MPGDPSHWGTVRASSYFLSPIHYGDLALILGFLSLFSINWTGNDQVALVTLKLAGFASSIVASLSTGSRGSWLAIPVLVFLWLYFRTGRRLLLPGVLTLLGVTIVAIPIIYFSPLVQARLAALLSDLAAYQHGNLSTGVTERVEMWRIAISLTLRESWIFGLGPDEFARRVPLLVEQGIMSKQLAPSAASELHGELVTKFVSLGLTGLVSVVAVYLVPASLFVRALRSSNAIHQATGRLGLCFVIGFFVFGLTIEIFALKMIATFYSFMVAVLLAGALHRDPETRNGFLAPAVAR
jgi:O-antigen ligase